MPSESITLGFRLSATVRFQALSLLSWGKCTNVLKPSEHDHDLFNTFFLRISKLHVTRLAMTQLYEQLPRLIVMHAGNLL